jgi:hypothetical protein
MPEYIRALRKHDLPVAGLCASPGEAGPLKSTQFGFETVFRTARPLTEPKEEDA